MKIDKKSLFIQVLMMLSMFNISCKNDSNNETTYENENQLKNSKNRNLLNTQMNNQSKEVRNLSHDILFDYENNIVEEFALLSAEYNAILSSQYSEIEKLQSNDNVREYIGMELDKISKEYNSGVIEVKEYNDKRIKLFSNNSKTKILIRTPLKKIRTAEEQYLVGIEKIVKINSTTFQKYIKINSNKGLQTISGLSPIDFAELIIKY